MSSFIFVEKVKKAAQVVVGASVTDEVVSDGFPISSQDAKDITVAVKYSDATVAAGIVVKLQTTQDEKNYLDHSTVAVTAATATETVKYIHMNENISTANFPLLSRGRIVVTTGAGDSVAIDSVRVSRRTK